MRLLPSCWILSITIGRLVPLQGMDSFFHDDSTLWSLLTHRHTPAFPCDNIFIESVEVIRVLIVLVFWCSAHGLIIVDFARRRDIIFRMSMVASFVASRCETLFRCSRSCLLGVPRSLVSCTISAAYLSSLNVIIPLIASNILSCATRVTAGHARINDKYRRLNSSQRRLKSTSRRFVFGRKL